MNIKEENMRRRLQPRIEWNDVANWFFLISCGALTLYFVGFIVATILKEGKEGLANENLPCAVLMLVFSVLGFIQACDSL